MRSLIGVAALALSLTTAGSLARQVFDLHAAGPVVGWTCPECGGANAGEPAVRTHAACRHCCGRFGWTEVVAPDRLFDLSSVD